MAFIEWNDSLSVKVEKFDNQHKRLIGIVNGLHDAMTTGRGKDVLESTLSALIEYTQTHFADEEMAMEKYSYPSLPTHALEHKKLTGQVLEFQKQYLNGEKYISIEILNFLKDWLVNHIMITDKAYGNYFDSKKLIVK